MADNVTFTPGSGGTLATDDIAGVQYPRTKLTIGADGVNDGDVSASNPLPGRMYVTDGTDTGTLKPVGFDTTTDLPAPVFVQGAAGAFDVVVSTDINIGNYPAIQTVLVDGSQTAIPVADAAVAAKLPDMVSTVPYNNSAAPPTRIVGQDIWTCSFASVGASVLSSDFGTPIVGTGVGYSQASGSLLITTGTTANQEFLTRSTTSWRGSLRLRASLVASQRIANNNLQIVLADLFGEGLAVTINSAVSITVTKVGHGLTSQNVGQFMQIGGIVGAAGVPGRYAIASVPTADTVNFTVAGWPASGSCTVTVFGWNYIRNLVTGTTATQMAWDCQRKGWATGDTTITINTTAGVGTIIQNDFNGRDAFVLDSLRASTTTPTVTARGSRYENIPDDDVALYVFIWSYNGTTNPASTTTWTLGFISVEKFANTPVYIQGSRANGAVNPLPVSFAQAQAVTVSSGTITTLSAISAGTNAIGDVGTQYRANATGAGTINKINSAASTNATVVKASAGRLIGYHLSNTNAAFRYVKLYNVSSAPTAGAGTIVGIIALPPTSTVSVSHPGGIAFSTGISYTMVTGAADADATAVAANDIVGHLVYA